MLRQMTQGSAEILICIHVSQAFNCLSAPQMETRNVPKDPPEKLKLKLLTTEKLKRKLITLNLGRGRTRTI